MLDERGLITLNRRIAQDFYLARLEAPGVARLVEPGQFVEVQVTSQYSPYLRLPLSVGQRDVQSGTLDLLYEAVGPKTAALRALPSGSEVACLGPLGRNFRAPPSDRSALLVGGGIGVPPLLFLGETLRYAGHDVSLLVGARTNGKHLPGEFLERAAQRVMLATDDGSLGHHGLITDLLAGAAEAAGACTVYTCGPHGMMAATAAICGDLGLSCQVSLEEYMACGTGVCVGCVVQTRRSQDEVTADSSPYLTYSRICVDGPVYDAERICW